MIVNVETEMGEFFLSIVETLFQISLFAAFLFCLPWKRVSCFQGRPTWLNWKLPYGHCFSFRSRFIWAFLYSRASRIFGVEINAVLASLSLSLVHKYNMQEKRNLYIIVGQIFICPYFKSRYEVLIGDVRLFPHTQCIWIFFHRNYSGIYDWCSDNSLNVVPSCWPHIRLIKLCRL